MEAGNLGRGIMIAGISGALLFIFMFFNWYSSPALDATLGQIDQATDVLGLDSAPDTSASLDAWDSFGFIDVLLLFAVIVPVGIAFMSLLDSSPGLPVAGSAIICGVGSLAFLLVLYRVINPPGEGLDREIGLWLGLLATAGIAAGGYLGMQEEQTSYSDQADRPRG